jgi:hypothetical protein
LIFNPVNFTVGRTVTTGGWGSIRDSLGRKDLRIEKLPLEVPLERQLNLRSAWGEA